MEENWRRYEEDDRDTILDWKATNKSDLVRGIDLVFKRMLANSVIDQSENSPALGFIIDVTNRNLHLFWYDPQTQKAQGAYGYLLYVNELDEPCWDESLDFEKASYFAICDFCEEVIYDEEGNQSHDIFYRYKAGSGLKEIIL